MTMTVTKDTIIAEILEKKPEAAPLFMEIGMHCLGCPAARAETLAEACAVHNVDADELLAKIQQA
jgi:hybrid cluster-associated redox disulfide protein